MSPIERSGGGGGGGGVVTQIFASTLTVAAANFDITAIPGTFSMLHLVCQLRTNSATAFVGNSRLTFNGDLGANYNWQFQRGQAANVSAGSTDGDTRGLGPMETENGDPANYFGTGWLDVPFYANTSTFKTAFGAGNTTPTGGNDDIRSYGFTWKSTAAITQITVAVDSGTAFMAGSACVLYGFT